MWHAALNRLSCSYFRCEYELSWMYLKGTARGQTWWINQRCWQMQKKQQNKMNFCFYDIINVHTVPHRSSLPVLLLESSLFSLLYTSHLIPSPHPGSRLMQSFFQRRPSESLFLLRKQNWPDLNAKFDLKVPTYGWPHCISTEGVWMEMKNFVVGLKMLWRVTMIF